MVLSFGTKRKLTILFLLLYRSRTRGNYVCPFGGVIMKVTLATTKKDILDHLYVRGQVFVIEQQIAYDIEFEGDDDVCDLFLCRIDGVAVGAARLKKNKIGRVATLKAYRHQGVARALMDYIENFAKEKGYTYVYLHAQKPVEHFYQKLGYLASGEIFYEADIPHVYMAKNLVGEDIENK